MLGTFPRNYQHYVTLCSVEELSEPVTYRDGSIPKSIWDQADVILSYGLEYAELRLASIKKDVATHWYLWEEADWQTRHLYDTMRQGRLVFPKHKWNAMWRVRGMMAKKSVEHHKIYEDQMNLFHAVRSGIKHDAIVMRACIPDTKGDE